MSLDSLIAAAQKNHGQIAPTPTGATYPLAEIKLRDNDTRSLNENHVQELAESIAVLGLIEPIALDQTGRLLAGAHRLAAIKQLQTEKPDIFAQLFPDKKVPARTFDFDADSNPDLALQIEIAENEKRRDYTSTEVKAIANRLRSAGFVDVKGRPKKGQKAIMPALSVVVGKSIRRIQQYMTEPEPPENKASTESAKYFVLLEKARKCLLQAEKISPNTSKAMKFSKSLPDILEQIDTALSDQSRSDKD